MSIISAPGTTQCPTSFSSDCATRARRQRTRVISFISAVSIVCIALGMTALITVLSVMNGFQREIRSRILAVASHVQITGGGRKASRLGTRSRPWRPATPRWSRRRRLWSGQGLLTNGPKVHGVFVRGILPAQEERVAEVGKHMKYGTPRCLEAR